MWFKESNKSLKFLFIWLNRVKQVLVFSATLVPNLFKRKNKKSMTKLQPLYQNHSVNEALLGLKFQQVTRPWNSDLRLDEKATYNLKMG